MSWNRREFIAKPLALVAATRVMSGFKGLQAAVAPEAQSAAVITRTLGRTGLRMPIVSMGVMNANIPGVVRRAYELGVRHFDTADNYQQGRNEEMLGKVIKELGVRKSVTITTKISIDPRRISQAGGKDAMRRIVEGSLQRLQMGSADILLLHGFDNAADATIPEAIEVLQALKKEGKTRFIGLSTHKPAEVLPAITKLDAFDVALFPLNFTMFSDKALHDAIDAAAKKGIGLMAMKTQAGGMSSPDLKVAGKLPLCSQTALLKWAMQHEQITTAIPGFTNYDQLESAFAVAHNLSYTPEEKAFLSEKNLSAKAEFCTQCSECKADCPKQAEVPTLMRSHMYAVQYGNHEHARLTLAALEAGKGLDACAGCDTCQVACRNSVNIARKIDELKRIHPMILRA